MIEKEQNTGDIILPWERIGSAKTTPEAILLMQVEFVEKKLEFLLQACNTNTNKEEVNFYIFNAVVENAPAWYVNFAKVLEGLGLTPIDLTKRGKKSFAQEKNIAEQWIKKT